MDKEEIENAKQCLNEIIQNTYAEGKAKKLDTLRKYINELEQKESILDKVTDKLKEDIKTNMENEETNTDGMKEYWRGCIDTEVEILEFIKGEKNNGK